MAIAKKVTSKNHLPGFGDDRFVVYSKQFNDLVDAVLEIEAADGVFSGTSMTLTGSALGTDALTLTAGDILLTSGNLDITTGDVTFADGSLSITDADNASSLTVLNNTATDVGAADSLAVARIASTSLTSGALLTLELTEATLSGGYYLRCWDVTGSANVFSILEDGATTIAGSASGTDALTITAGDITLTDGDATLTTGDLVLTDGVVVQTQETVTTGSPALKVYGATSLDSSGGAITGTLGSGENIGDLKTIVMTEASTSSTISITNHETSDPEVATFNALDEYWLGLWTGTEWVTVANTCTFV